MQLYVLSIWVHTDEQTTKLSSKELLFEERDQKNKFLQILHKDFQTHPGNNADV